MKVFEKNILHYGEGRVQEERRRSVWGSFKDAVVAWAWNGGVRRRVGFVKESLGGIVGLFARECEEGRRVSDVLFEAGMRAWKDEGDELALCGFEAAVREDASNFEASLGAGLILYEEGRYDEAERYLRVVAEQEGLGFVREAYMRSLAFVGKHGEALDLSRGKDERLEMAEWVFGLGDIAGGIMWANAVLELDPEDFKANVIMGRGLVELESYVEAEGFLERADGYIENSCEGSFYWGKCLVGLGKFSRADVRFMMTVKLARAGNWRDVDRVIVSGICFEIGEYYFSKPARYREAKAYFEEAFRLDSKRLQDGVILAFNTLSEHGRQNDCTELLSWALKARLNQGVDVKELVRLYVVDDRRTEHTIRMECRGRRAGFLNLELGTYMLRKERYGEAVKCLEKAIEVKIQKGEWDDQDEYLMMLGALGCGNSEKVFESVNRILEYGVMRPVELTRSTLEGVVE